MTQISKSDLPLEVKFEIYNQLNRAIAQCHDEESVEILLSELLTKTERTIIANRLFIAALLVKGYSYRDIRIILHVSFPTIRSVQFWLDHGGEGYKKAVDVIIKSQENVSLFTAIDRYIDNEAKSEKKKLV